MCDERGDQEKNRDGDWVELLRLPTLAEAEVVASALQGAGIAVSLRYDPAGSVILGPGSVNPFSGVSLRVRDGDLDSAQELLDELQEDDNCQK